MSSSDYRNFIIQGVLIVFYMLLTVLFALNKKTWPSSAYYLGCVVKDAAVLAMGWFLASKK